MTSAREHGPGEDEDKPVDPVEPADMVKPVELIELLQRRTQKRRQPEAPTSSPFYDAEFVVSHRKQNRRKSD